MEEERLIPNPPRENDVLFRDDLPDWSNNAGVNVSWGGDDFGYTEGYRRGARLLVEYVIENQNDQDFLVYPILFLYRHHVELALKRIILQAPHIIDRALTNPETQHLGKHRLDLLWQDLKPMFAAVCKAAGWTKLSSADEKGIDSYIRQLTELDADSFSFRYARSKMGTRSLPERLKRINLRHFAEVIERLANYLNALDTALSGLGEAKAEMEAEWRNDMDSYRDRS